MKKKQDRIEQICKLLPVQIQEQLGRLESTVWDKVQEIRLQTGKSIYLTLPGQTISIDNILNDTNPKLTNKDLEESFASLCEYSVHTYLPQIQKGYITLKGGHRVGLGGSAVIKDGQVASVQNITSLNIRISREEYHDMTSLVSKIFSDGICSVLIAGEPSSGKTTMLRDLAVYLSQHYRVSVVDERGEILPEESLQFGGCLDRLKGFPKSCGILQAVRTLSPQIVVCDEIGDKKETEQLLEAIHCGVVFLGSIHAGSLSELKHRPQFETLLEEQAFEKIILLQGASFPMKISGIYKVKENQLVRI